jgi:hypothetical protein
MPIKECKLPNGKDGFQWGDHGKCYPDRAQAEEQAAAAHANGFTGDAEMHTVEDLSTNQSLTPEGYLLCKDVAIGRTGIQIYRKGEVFGIEMGPDGTSQVERTADEVFHPDSMASFEGKPITMLHPDEMVNPSNWKEVACGTVRNVRRVDNLLTADMLITDEDAIHIVRNKLISEVSCGYDAEYDQTKPGYAIQRGIVGNHVALVPKGRCGTTCSIKDHDMSKTTWKDRILAAVRSNDCDTVKKEIKDAPEGDVHIHLPSEQEEDPIETRFKAIEDAIAGMTASKDAEVEKGDDKDEDEDDDEDEGYTGDAWTSIVQRAAIVSPGLKLTVPAGDANSKSFKDSVCGCKRQSLKAASKDALDVVLQGRTLDKLSGKSLDAVFSAVSAIMAARNNVRDHKPVIKDATITKNELMKANIEAMRAANKPKL